MGKRVRDLLMHWLGNYMDCSANLYRVRPTEEKTISVPSRVIGAAGLLYTLHDAVRRAQRLNPRMEDSFFTQRHRKAGKK